MILGLATLILGIIVIAFPGASLGFIAVLLGVLVLISGGFDLVRAFNADERHRAWLGIAGVVFLAAGIILILHVNLTMRLIAVAVGITWIVQGLAALFSGLAGGPGRGWWITFGLISLIAGIVVIATPLASLAFLAVLLGVWFIVMGVFEIAGALVLRHAAHTSGALHA